MDAWVYQDGDSCFRAAVFHFCRQPKRPDDHAAYEFIDDALLILRDGKVAALGSYLSLRDRVPSSASITRFDRKLIVPGLIDTHIHYSQTDIIASCGDQLLEWLKTWTFPVEKKFGNKQHADAVARFFIDELLRNGTTTALVLPTVHPTSVDAVFEAAAAKNMRMIAGKVLMDRNAPADLLDTPGSGFDQSCKLIEKWHGNQRLMYAVTPRFAPTSSEAQLETVRELLSKYPDVYCHTHLAENRDEVRWVADLFKWSRSYLDVYDAYRLLRKRSVFAHAIHLGDGDFRRLSASGATISFCPSSNLFLGSGMFNLDKARAHGIPVGIGTDVGGGTSFSILKTLGEAHKVCQFSGSHFDSLQAFYMATLGGAEGLHLADKIGNFLPGKEADFVVMDLESTPLLTRRMGIAESLTEKLFLLMMLGDDRAVAAAYVMGEEVYKKSRGDSAAVLD
jgi:guanine deaminase